MFPEKSISSLSMSSFYHEKLELQKALCSLLKQIFENPEESPVRQKSIETLLLMLDHLPLKSRLSGLQKYYDKAIEVTKRDVRKNIANFPSKSRSLISIIFKLYLTGKLAIAIWRDLQNLKSILLAGF